MIRDGDRVAVALSGGKDSLTLLEALLLLSKRAPIDFSVCAFTVEQGKFLRPIEPLGDYLKSRGIDWTYFHDRPSFRLLEEQPDHGCDLCSRYGRQLCPRRAGTFPYRHRIVTIPCSRLANIVSP